MTMRSEIGEQSEVFRRVLDASAAAVSDVAEQITAIAPRYAVIAARGTSDNAARYAKYLWGAHNRLPVALAAPSLFTAYRRPPCFDEALVVGISQSGASPDLVAVLTEARGQGRPTLAITNDPASPLAAEADMVLDIGAGPEHAVAATKTYTAQLLAVAMLSTALNRGEGGDALAEIPSHMDAVLGVESAIARVAEEYADLRACAVLGRGYNHATAFEWALKVQEVTYALAHPYSTADFRHGPIAVVDPGFPILAVAPDGPLLADMVALLADLGGKRARTFAVSNRSEALEVARHGIELPETMREWVSPMIAIVAGQLFAYHLGLVKGLDTDRPRGLSKVTRTT